jgi:hypothetical protein
MLSFTLPSEWALARFSTQVKLVRKCLSNEAQREVKLSSVIRWEMEGDAGFGGDHTTTGRVAWRDET